MIIKTVSPIYGKHEFSLQDNKVYHLVDGRMDILKDYNGVVLLANSATVESIARNWLRKNYTRKWRV